MDTKGSPPEMSNQESIGSLLSGLIGDLQQLIRGEVALAKTEVRDELKGVARGAGMLGAAAIVGLVGLTVLMLGVATYLERWLDQWQAQGLVGAVLLVLAILAALAGRSRLRASAITPDRTVASLKEDKQWASQQVKSIRN
jgi:uncharacterized membrane protein YqjE